MNIQARNIRRSPRQKSRAGASLKARMLTILNIAIFCGAVFVIANAKIALNQEISDTEKKIARLKSEITQHDLELEQLRIEKETLTSWPHIRGRIQAFRLPLRPAWAGQTLPLAVSPRRGAEPAAAATARNGIR